MDEWKNEGLRNRDAEYPIDTLFLNRWSPRSMTGETIPEQELMSLFESARWAPSSMNNQPWRFIYALRDSDHWKGMFDLLATGNQVWAKNASALVIIISSKLFDHNGKTSITHSFDTGAAWMSLALAGSLKGYVIHCMQGFDYKKAREFLDLSDDYSVEAMVAVGIRDKRESLPPELQQREIPSDRKPLHTIVFAGKFES